MGSEFTFYDFLEAGVTNEVNQWLHGPGSKARAKLNQIIANLEGMRPPWPPKPWRELTERGSEDLYEVRCEIDKVQYRLIAFRGPMDRTVTLTMGVVHKDNHWIPSNYVSVSQHRRELIFSSQNPTQYQKEHDDG